MDSRGFATPTIELVQSGPTRDCNVNIRLVPVWLLASRETCTCGRHQDSDLPVSVCVSCAEPTLGSIGLGPDIGFPIEKKILGPL